MFKKKIIMYVLIAVLCVGLIPFGGNAVHAASVGEIIQFGNYNWRVLDVQGDRTLIITENIIEERPYEASWIRGRGTTWETSTLRTYLNGEFLRRFSSQDQGRIVETTISNPDNLWYGTSGGNDTRDRIFLLSLEEVDRYFGNSGDYVSQRRMKASGGGWPPGGFVSDSQGEWLSNVHDGDRIARYNGEPIGWWLRSPGDHTGFSFGATATVWSHGVVYVEGEAIEGNGIIGVRPALWLNLSATSTPTPPTRPISVTLNGSPVSFDQQPIIENGRTLVPLRAIFEALGAEVTWNQSAQTATAVKDNITVTIKIGDSFLMRNGQRIPLDVPAQLVNNRTLIPARAVAEAFGATVNWDASTRTVIITD